MDLELGLQPKGRRWKESERDWKIFCLTLSFCISLVPFTTLWVLILQRLTWGWKLFMRWAQLLLHTNHFPLQTFLPQVTKEDDLIQSTCAVLGTVSDRRITVMMRTMMRTESRNDPRLTTPKHHIANCLMQPDRRSMGLSSFMIFSTIRTVVPQSNFFLCPKC